jgi:hypothetical protein
MCLRAVFLMGDVTAAACSSDVTPDVSDGGRSSFGGTALDHSKCVKILAPATNEFAKCEPVFVTYQIANRLKRSGMATVINQRPFVLRLRLHAVSYMHFQVWSPQSGMKFQLLPKRKRRT